MKVTDREKRLISEALGYYSDNIAKYLSCTNATDREWQKVEDLNKLNTYFQMTLIDENYER